MKMVTKSVIVLPYDEQWEQAFAHIKYEIQEALGSLTLRIEHVGSTSAREAFKYDGKEHLQKHHLYVCPQDSAEFNRHVAFRNHLRSNPEAVIEKYIQHKSPFIEKIYKEIGV